MQPPHHELTLLLGTPPRHRPHLVAVGSQHLMPLQHVDCIPRVGKEKSALDVNNQPDKNERQHPRGGAVVTNGVLIRLSSVQLEDAKRRHPECAPWRTLPLFTQGHAAAVGDERRLERHQDCEHEPCVPMDVPPGPTGILVDAVAACECERVQRDDQIPHREQPAGLLKTCGRREQKYQ